MIAKHSSRQPSPVSAEMANHLPFQRYALRKRCSALFALIRRQHVGLVEHQPARLVVQRLIVFLQFVDDGARVLDRIHAVVEGRDVDDVQQQARAREVAQELVAQPGAFGRALDQSGNVGDDEAPVLGHAHHAQVGVQGGEGIVGDLRAGGRYRADEGRFAGVGHAQQADVGEQLQFQAQFARFARLAQGALARRAVGAGLEMQIAQAAFAARARSAPFARAQPDPRSVRRTGRR